MGMEMGIASGVAAARQFSAKPRYDFILLTLVARGGGA